MTKEEWMTPEEYIAMVEEEKKSEWYWEIWDKKTNKPNEVIAWLIVEKAKLEEENKKLEEEVKDLVGRNIELDKKYMLVLTENRKLKAELELKNLALKQAQEWSILI